MPNCNEPSCWRTAAITFIVLAGVVLVVALAGGGGDGTAIAMQ